MDALRWRPLVESDYEPVLATLSAWSSGRDFHALLPRLFFAHFSATSLIAEDADARLAGFVVAFVSQAHPGTGYIHFVWVSPEQRGHGVARTLYERVFVLLRECGCRHVEAVTIPENAGSLAFHERMGFTAVGTGGSPFEAPVVTDHAGPGEHRVVLVRQL
ncbi:MAG: GNAT family N-acetyltransferase [Candidatus Nanopelagicales bacterium]|jgi:ribosomal protein S18 acetylase RimI-like enzyme|nr:GNAT family N-acetyltransferase [Candidatus Nanopelagicales bacterium]